MEKHIKALRIYLYIQVLNLKTVDMLITNFHLPKSSLLMLVSALSVFENTKKIYEIAVKEKYRFLSYGDAMLLKKMKFKSKNTSDFAELVK